jgi:L-lactate transport
VLAAAYTQNLDPLHNPLISTTLAALPVVVLFYLLVGRRWLASWAGAAGALTAVLVAWLAFGMPLPMAASAFVHGALFGLMPVGWTVFGAMLLYNVTVETGQFAVVRRSVASLSGDARIQAILIGFAFGAFLEGAAGSGSPVAVCGAMLVGLGFHPFTAAVICLIANTSPVAYGGLGTPIITLAGVTGLSDKSISVMAGHQLPFLSCLVPFYMVLVMCGWNRTREVWPALVVAGGSFAVFQYAFATAHQWTGIVLYPMTDIGGGIFALVVTALFLRVWRPRREWHYDPPLVPPPVPSEAEAAGNPDPHAAEAVAEAKTILDDTVQPVAESPLTTWTVAKAWMPFALMSVLLMATGFLRQIEKPGRPIPLGPIQSRYDIPIPMLHEQVERAARLQEPGRPAAPEQAEFAFVWLTAAGTPVFVAAILAGLMLRMSWAQAANVVRKTCVQMRVPIPTIACMLGLSYVTRYSGMDATLGVAFASTGVLYPFFAAILGWLGVFLTGTDAGSNALFGSLQKITATELFRADTFTHLTLDQSQVLICTANSTGGVMGKMIDAQSICVATAATHQIGKEADIFKAVVWHSILLAAIVGTLTLVQAYVPPLTRMVPGSP